MATKSKEELKEELYQERFDRLDEKLDDIKDMLISKASAGSVQRLEDRIKILETTHIPCSTVTLALRELEDIKKNKADLVDFNTHREKCKSFLVEDFEPIKLATDGVVYFNKHPFQFKAIIVGAIVIFLFATVSTVASGLLVLKISKELKTEMAIKKP